MRLSDAQVRALRWVATMDRRTDGPLAEGVDGADIDAMVATGHVHLLAFPEGTRLRASRTGRAYLAGMAHGERAAKAVSR